MEFPLKKEDEKATATITAANFAQAAAGEGLIITLYHPLFVDSIVKRTTRTLLLGFAYDN